VDAAAPHIARSTTARNIFVCVDHRRGATNFILYSKRFIITVLGLCEMPTLLSRRRTDLTTKRAVKNKGTKSASAVY
jgi:hypothetical protein